MLIRRSTLRHAPLILIFSLGCNGSAAPASQNSDEGSDKAETPLGSDSETHATSDSDSGTDKKEPENLGSAGEACWRDIFEQWHPNYGLPDCGSGLACIGNSEQALCSERCDETGAINHENPSLDNWCCGELADPCDPQRFWLPQSMSAYCIPRDAGLAEPCDMSKEWTGTQVRCEPVCKSKATVLHTQCVAPTPNELLCSIQCDPLNADADCLIEPAFAGGCCREMMGGHWCLPAASCL